MKMHSSLITRIFLVAFVTFLTDEAAASGGKPEILAARQASLPGSILSTPTMTTPTSTSQPSITPILLFEPSLAYTACSAGVIQWLFAGPSSRTLTIMVNNDVPQDNPPPPLTSSSSRAPAFTDLLGRQAPPSGSTFPDTVNKTLSSTLDPTSDSYSWPSVNVPQGWYQAVAIVPVFGQIAQSDPFYVREGADTSCLVAPTPTSSGASAATSPPSTSSPPAMTSGGVAVPDSTSSSSTTPTGAIVGGIIGGIILVAAMLLGCFYMSRRRKSQRSLNMRGTDKDDINAAGLDYAGLQSVDSTYTTKRMNQPRRNISNGSSARSFGYNSRRGSMGPGALNSDDAVGSAHSPSEKFGASSMGHGSYPGQDPFDDARAVALAAIPGDPRVQRSSSQSSTHYPYPHPRSNEFGAPGGRRPSVPDSVIVSNNKRASMDASTYPPSPTVQPGGVALTRSTSRRSSVGYSPTSPIEGAGNRGSFSARKATRKPVPAYDFEMDSGGNSSSGNVNNASSGNVNSSTGTLTMEPSPIDSDSTNQSPVVGVHYSTRNQAQGHDLVHKSSFGPGGVEGKPLHYLIPDMPMPAK